MRADIEIDCEQPELVARALQPDIAKAERFSARVGAEKGKLRLLIEAADIAGLLAGINGCGRLVRAALAAQEVK